MACVLRRRRDRRRRVCGEPELRRAATSCRCCSCARTTATPSTTPIDEAAGPKRDLVRAGAEPSASRRSRIDDGDVLRAARRLPPRAGANGAARRRPVLPRVQDLSLARACRARTRTSTPATARGPSSSRGWRPTRWRSWRAAARAERAPQIEAEVEREIADAVAASPKPARSPTSERAVLLNVSSRTATLRPSGPC